MQPGAYVRKSTLPHTHTQGLGIHSSTRGEIKALYTIPSELLRMTESWQVFWAVGQATGAGSLGFGVSVPRVKRMEKTGSWVSATRCQPFEAVTQ